MTQKAAMEENVRGKVNYYVLRVLRDDRDLCVGIFTDSAPHSLKMWSRVFAGAIEPEFVTQPPLIQVPQPYNPEQYDNYEALMEAYVQQYLESKNMGLVGGLFNIGTKAEPKMNLLVANRRLKRGELGDRAEEGEPPPGYITVNELREKLTIIQEVSQSRSSSTSSTGSTSSKGGRVRKISSSEGVPETISEAEADTETCGDPFDDSAPGSSTQK